MIFVLDHDFMEFEYLSSSIPKPPKNSSISFLDPHKQCSEWTHPVREISFRVCFSNVVLYDCSVEQCYSCPLVVDSFLFLEVFSSFSEHVDFIVVHNSITFLEVHKQCLEWTHHAGEISFSVMQQYCSSWFLIIVLSREMFFLSFSCWFFLMAWSFLFIQRSCWLHCSTQPRTLWVFFWGFKLIILF